MAPHAARTIFVFVFWMLFRNKVLQNMIRAIAVTFILPCVCVFGFVCYCRIQFARFVKWCLHRQQVSALLAEEKADEETCSSSSCDFIESMSEPDAGGSGATSPSLPAAIEQREMLQTDVALHPSLF